MDPLSAKVAARYKGKKKLDSGNVVYEYSKRQVQLRNRDKAKRLEKLRSAGPEGGLASLAGGWKGSSEVVRIVAEHPRTGYRVVPDLDEGGR